MYQKTITNPEEYQRQKAALLYFQSPFMVRLLEFDDVAQTLTMEHLPGKTLKEFFPDQENESIALTCNLIQNLHQLKNKSDYPFSDLQTWGTTLYRSHPLPIDLLNQAQTLLYQLLNSTSHPVLLHGDLHCDNIML